eukprot:gene5219-22328_t
MKMKEDHTRLPLLATGSIQGGAPAFADALVTRSAVFIAMALVYSSPLSRLGNQSGTVLQNPANDTDKPGLGISEAESDMFVSSVTFGAVTAALGASWLLDIIGRRGCLFVCALFFIGGGAIQATAHSFVQLMVGRLMVGLGTGLASVAAPIGTVLQNPANDTDKPGLGISEAESDMFVSSVTFGAVSKYGTVLQNPANDTDKPGLGISE